MFSYKNDRYDTEKFKIVQNQILFMHIFATTIYSFTLVNL